MCIFSFLLGGLQRPRFKGKGNPTTSLANWPDDFGVEGVPPFSLVYKQVITNNSFFFSFASLQS